MPRRIRHSKKALFLEAYGNGGVVTQAALAAGVHRSRHYQWLEEDSQYAEAFDEAQAAADDALLVEVRKRAIEGKDTTMMIVQLKMRGLFNDRREITGAGGGPVTLAVLTDEDRAIASRIATRRLGPALPPPQPHSNGSTHNGS